MRKLPIEVAVFDLDGTLIDSAPVVADILNGMRAERGNAPIDVSLYRNWSSIGGALMVQHALGLDTDAASELAEFRARYYATLTSVSSVYPGVRDVLNSLRSERIGMAICTNKPRRLAEKVLIETGLRGYFHSVVGGDSTTRTKPHRDPLDYALKHFTALPSAAIMIGDSTVDQRTAKAAAIPFVFFTGGYDDGVDSADYRISSIADIIAIVDPSKRRRPGHVEEYG